MFCNEYIKVIVFCGVITCCKSQVSTNSSQGFDCGITEESPNDLRTLVPWITSIYYRQNPRRPFKYRTMGVIISPTTILTIFSGAYGQPNSSKGKYIIPDPSNFKVAVGMKTNQLEDVDEFSQILEVAHIVPFTGKDFKGNKIYHHYILHLSSEINLETPFARILCIPTLFSSKHFHRGVSLGVVETIPFFRQGGFGVPVEANGSNSIKVIQTILGNATFCAEVYRKFYTGAPVRVFCAKLKDNMENGTEVDDSPAICNLLGSSFVTKLQLEKRERFYFGGFTAAIPPIDPESNWCNKNTVYLTTIFAYAIEWMLNNIRCGPTKFSCDNEKCIEYDLLCNGVPDCPKSEDEDPIFCRGRKPCLNSFDCGNNDECIPDRDVCDGIQHCLNGKDENNLTCEVDE